MKLYKGKIAALLSTALLLATSLGNATTGLADTTTTNNVNTEQQTTDTKTSTNENTTSSNTTNNNETSNDVQQPVAKTQATTSVDTSAIKAAMLTEINDLRAQNGLNSLTSVDVLNNYAQERTDGFAYGVGVDAHVGWNSANMAPYNLTAEENIAQVPLGTLSNDPTAIAKSITQEFYQEKNDKIPDYGHRKNMLNPYIGYIGIGVTVGTNGMIYFAQEMGNDADYAAKSTLNQRNAYYQTTLNDYANPSKYDVIDQQRQNSSAAADYVQNGSKYTYFDLRGGASTRDSYVNMYDRDGNIYTNLRLAPQTDWASDIVSIINGTYFLHVSTNGFVKAADVLPWASFLSGITVTANKNAVIYDDYGNPTSRSVAQGSAWVTDRRSINFVSNTKYLRIGTNAWLAQSDTNNIVG